MFDENPGIPSKEVTRDSRSSASSERSLVSDEDRDVSEVLGVLDPKGSSPLTMHGESEMAIAEDCLEVFRQSKQWTEDNSPVIAPGESSTFSSGTGSSWITEAEGPPEKKSRLESGVDAGPLLESGASSSVSGQGGSCDGDRSGFGFVSHAYEPPPLPEDWVQVGHSSGGSVYFHKPSRVCTLARPYHLRSSFTVKGHRIPVQAIPCLEQWLFRERKSEMAEQWHSTMKTGALIKIEPHRLKEYLSLRWELSSQESSERKRVDVLKPANSSLKEKRQNRKKKQKVLLPEAMSKILCINISKEYRQQVQGKRPPAVWTVNTASSTPVTLLFEFCGQYLQISPDMRVEETGHKNTPYVCTVTLGGVRYGQGRAATKKLAKHAAAQETLELLLPGQFKSMDSSALSQPQLMEYFSSVNIDDPQADQMLHQAGLSNAWHYFNECYRRNVGTLPLLGEIQFSLTPIPSEASKFEYRLSCGEAYTVGGQCYSKKEGQQLAAQAMLKKLHPYITNWAGLLRIYTEKHMMEHERRTDALDPQPKLEGEGSVDLDSNLLERLKSEMRKLASESDNSHCDYDKNSQSNTIRHKHLQLHST